MIFQSRRENELLRPRSSPSSGLQSQNGPACLDISACLTAALPPPTSFAYISTARHSKGQKTQDTLENRAHRQHAHLSASASAGPVPWPRPAGTVDRRVSGLVPTSAPRPLVAPPLVGWKALRAHLQLQRRFRPLNYVVLREFRPGD